MSNPVSFLTPELEGLLQQMTQNELIEFIRFIDKKQQKNALIYSERLEQLESDLSRQSQQSTAKCEQLEQSSKNLQISLTGLLRSAKLI